MKTMGRFCALVLSVCVLTCCHILTCNLAHRAVAPGGRMSLDTCVWFDFFSFSFLVEFWRQSYVCESFVLTSDPFDPLVGCASLPVRPERQHPGRISLLCLQ